VQVELAQHRHRVTAAAAWVGLADLLKANVSQSLVLPRALHMARS
jgi:hypothetical protein